MSDTAMDTTSVIMAAVIHVIILAVVAWDLYVSYTGRPDQMVSYIVAGWARVWPMLPFATGVLIGHLFWCQRMH